jgi:hypothetical protein
MTMKKTASSLIAALLLASLPAFAADEASAPPPGSTPVPDGAPTAGEIEEPSITIRSRGGERIEEYRLRGKLYMIRITPPGGAPYYLVDQMGRGEFARDDGPVAPTAVPHWVLKTF